MGRASNTLKGSDLTTTPIRVKYSQSYSSDTMGDYGISAYNGTNIPIGVDGNFTQEYLNYASARQMYYKSYITGSILGSGSGWNDNLQSTAASGTFDNDFRSFPTTISSSITTLSIPMSAFGERVARHSFDIRFNNYGYHLVDDGNGNIIDSNNSNAHVGNILYAQGMVIITNQTYIPLFAPYYNNFTFYVNSVSSSAGLISSSIEITLQGGNTLTYRGGSDIFTGLNTFYPTYSGPYDIQFRHLYQSGSIRQALAIVFDNITPINNDNTNWHNYTWITRYEGNDFNTDGNIFAATNTPIAPIVEVALVPIGHDQITITFNHFDTTLDPTATITVTNYNTSTILFTKTIGDIITDNLYSYLIPTAGLSGILILTEINGVKRADGSDSYVTMFSRLGANPNVFDTRIKGLGHGSIASIFDDDWYGNINIQLEYAS